MRRMTCLSVSLGAVVCLTTFASNRAAAQAGVLTKPTAGVYGGVTVPRGELNDEVGLGWNGGAFAKIRLYGPLDARIDGTYVKFGKKDLVGTDATVTTNASVVFGTLDALINLGTDSAAYPGDNSVSPYLMFGGGKYSLDFDATCVGAQCGLFVNPDRNTYWGINAGGGATVPLAGIRTFLEARYHRISRDELDGGSRAMVVISAGVKFR